MSPNPYAEIERGAPGTIGWRIHYFDEVGSTQKVAAEMVEAGAASGTVVIADQQTAGRGRLGRSWHSPPGKNLYATVILRPKMPIAEVPRLSLVAGVAAAEAIATVAPRMVALKWPNDVWLKGRKAGGIIAEAVTDPAQNLVCVLLGIGLNLNLSPADIPEELQDKATSVRIATGRHCDRIEVAASLFNRLDSRYMEAEAHGFAAIRADYESYFALTGKTVTVSDGATRVGGRVAGVDNEGALMLETDEGLQRILAGEVSVEGAYD
jgi:BirA family transcriptional regulator, biotin operon repressor / biotin---[acetyl-CoA-carboxylase] ligase